MKALCNHLGYTFNDMKLLETALTHPSYGGDHHVPHYQRLEFLGDAVLELAISRYLYFEFPEVDEGKLTRIRAGLVGRRPCAGPRAGWIWESTYGFPWARIAPAGVKSPVSCAT